MPIGEVRSVWNTPGGGVGYSVWHFDDVDTGPEAQLVTDLVSSWFNGIKAILPNEVSVQSDSEVRVLDVLTGSLISVLGVTPPATITGTSAAVYNRAAGVRVDFSTNVIAGGRRLKGRKYIVPIDATAFDATGLLIPSVVTTITNATTNLLSAASAAGAQMVVWSRANGIRGNVASFSVPRQGAILRGRRD